MMVIKRDFLTFTLIIFGYLCKADSIPQFIHLEKTAVPFETLHDSDLTTFQIYNQAFQYDLFAEYAGNLGAPVITPFRPNEINHQEESGLNALAIYEYNPHFINPNLNKNNFSQLNYNLGAKLEQRLRIQHLQKAAGGLRFGIDFNVLGSPGFYSRQFHKQRSLDLLASYNTRNNKYRLEGHYTSNRFESEENGGIIDDSLFVNAENLNANLVGINLPDAQSRFQSRYYSFQHSLGFLPQRDIDSTRNLTDPYKLRLHHRFLVERTNRLFEVNSFGTGFFKNFYRDSSQTKDSLFLRNYLQLVGLSFSDQATISPTSQVRYRLFAFGNRHDYRYWLYDREIELTMLDVHFGGSLLINDKLSLHSSWKIGVDNTDEVMHTAGVTYFISSLQGSVEINYSNSEQRTSLISREFSGNHHQWSNDFDQTRSEEINAAITVMDMFQVKARRTITADMVYFDKEGIAQQFSTDVLYQSLDLLAKQSLGKFRFREAVRLQDTDHPELLPVPDLSAFASTYFESVFFKRELPIQFGFDWRYNTAFVGREYNPATMQFQLQEDQEIGEYLYVDFFLNFRIKKTMIYMKMAHLNEGFSDRNYFLMPHNPMPGRAFRFGLQWTFDD